jgi:hypothetical protein
LWMRFEAFLDSIIQPMTQNSWIRESAVYGETVHDIASVDGADDMEKSSRKDH